MTLREELLQIIGHLPDSALETLAPAIRAQDVRCTPADWRAALARVRAFRAAMQRKYGTMPDAVTLTVERRVARMLRIMTPEAPAPVTSLHPEEPPQSPRAAA